MERILAQLSDFISRVSFEKLTVSQPVTKFPEMYVFRRIINAITKTLTLVSILSHTNSLHTLLLNFLKTREIFSFGVIPYRINLYLPCISRHLRVLFNDSLNCQGHTVEVVDK